MFQDVSGLIGVGRHRAKAPPHVSPWTSGRVAGIFREIALNGQAIGVVRAAVRAHRRILAEGRSATTALVS